MRWADWRTRCPCSVGAASRPMCQLAWRSGCSEAARNPTTTGASAADVPQSAATGAAVEPVRALQAFTAFSGPAAGLAGDRGDDLAGVQRTTRSGVNGTPASSSSGLVHAQREGTQARDPRARERAAVVNLAGTAGLTRLFRIAMKVQP